MVGVIFFLFQIGLFHHTNLLNFTRGNDPLIKRRISKSTVECIMPNDQQTVDSVKWTVDSGQCKVESGQIA